MVYSRYILKDEINKSAHKHSSASAIAFKIRSDDLLEIEDISKKIKQLVALTIEQNIKLARSLNGQFVLLFLSSINSEKHTLQAYQFYNKLNKLLVAQELRALLIVGEVDEIDGYYTGDIIVEAMEFLNSNSISNHNLIYSAGAVTFLEQHFSTNFTRMKNVINKKKYFCESSPARSKRHIDPTFCGRNVEMQIIDHSVQKNNHVCVVGSPGVGKSSLIRSFIKRKGYKSIECSFSENYYEDCMRIILNSLYSQITGKVLQEFNEIINFISGYHPVTTKVATHIKNTYSSDVFKKPFSPDIAECIVAVLEALSSKYKLCLFFDDIQWATEGYSRFIDVLSKASIRIPTFSTSRNHPKYPNIDVVALKSLSKGSTSLLINKLIPEDFISENFVDDVYNQSSGNPYYIMEVMRAFINRMQDHSPDRTYDMVEFNSIPINIKNLIDFQMDRLPIDKKYILDLCSCIGQKFSIDFISEIIKEESIDVRECMQFLHENDFLSFDLRSNEYSFIHSIKEGAVYKRIPMALKKELHRKILSHLVHDKNKHQLLISRQHFLAANWTSSYMHNVVLAKKYLNDLEPSFAIKALDMAIESAGKLNLLNCRRDIKLKLMMSRAYFMLGDVNKASEFIPSHYSIISNDLIINNNDLWNEAVSELTFLLWIKADYQGVLDLIDELQSKFADRLNPETASAINIRRIGVLSDMGDLYQAQDLIEELLARSYGLTSKSVFPIKAALNAMKARNYAFLGQKSKFLAIAQKELISLQNFPKENSKIFTLCYLASGYLEINMHEKAYKLLSEASDLMDRHSIYVLKGYIHCMLGHCEVLRGEINGMTRITSSIYEAQKFGRNCRLPLLYLFLARSFMALKNRPMLKKVVLKGKEISYAQKEFHILGLFCDMAHEEKLIATSRSCMTGSNIVLFDKHKRDK